VYVEQRRHAGVGVHGLDEAHDVVDVLPLLALFVASGPALLAGLVEPIRQR
jgi:hypothetical protein